MVSKSKGRRRKTRHKLKQRPGYRPSITKFLQEFSPGQRVLIEPEPSSHSGVPFHRFKGKVGVVVEQRGRAYAIKITDGKKTKLVISRPEHLKRLNLKI